MECNREEALRAKEIAEMKFLAKDMKGAKKFALKAQNLYPGLEGISQMVMTLEVYISAEEEKMNGESNWYGVLGLTPLADDESIRKQYRRLALLLHPDKNRSIGAEGAFHFISQAWNLLSDNSKRKGFDQRCGRLQKKDQGKNAVPSPSPAQNGFHNFANTAASEMRAQKGNNSKRNPSASPHPPRKKDRRTFWTVCHQCKMQYEYLRMYLNHNLLCPNCREAYFAIEIDPPSTMGTKIPSQTSNSQQRKNTSQQASDASRNKSGTHHGTSKNGSNPNNFKWVPFTESTCTPSAVQAANMVQQAYEKVKQERQKAQAAAKREEALRRKNIASKRKLGGEPSQNSEALKRRKGAEDQSMKEKMKLESFQKCESSHDAVRRVGIKDLVMEKARNDIQKKLNQSISATVGRNVTIEDSLTNEKEIETSTKNDSLNTHKLGESLETELPQNKQSFRSSDSYLDDKLVEQMCIDVVEPDFHDFDKSRTENCFGVNQVWALYDDVDGMPRNYAMIENVISLNPFKVSIRWLSSATHNRIGNGSWFLSGFLKTYGEFGVGRHDICNSIDCFSHKVRWMKLSSKTVSILPRKGDVWALYRNWSPEWNELTEDAVMHEYDMVEVVEDCDEELGVIVVPLVKVVGFKSVFHQHFDPREIRRIPKEELCRFSHQVPSRLVTKGCLELDPAAIPSEFLQLMSDPEEIDIVKAVDGDFITSTDTVGVS